MHAENTENTPDFQTFAAEVQQWQRETFPGGTSEGAAQHLYEEADELLLEIGLGWDHQDFGRIQEEAADVFLLLIAVAGLEGFDLMKAAQDKMAINRARTWETVPNERGYRKHIQTETPS